MFKYKVKSKWLKPKNLKRYLNKKGKKGILFISIKKGGANIQGKYHYKFISIKLIT